LAENKTTHPDLRTLAIFQKEFNMTEMHEFESLFYKIRNSAEPKKSNDVKDLTNFLRYNSVQPSFADQGYSVLIISKPRSSQEDVASKESPKEQASTYHF